MILVVILLFKINFSNPKCSFINDKTKNTINIIEILVKMKRDIAKLKFLKFMLPYTQAKNAPRCKNCLCILKSNREIYCFFIYIHNLK